MAFSRSAARTARHRRWLWALTACGGAASLIAVEGHLQESAREHGQTTAEFAKERATEAANHLKKTTGVAGALLRTAVSSAMSALQQRSFDPGDFRADLAATVADLVSETPTRRHLVALGGGFLLDWLLQLAYPQLPDPTSTYNSSSSSTPSSSGSGSVAARVSERGSMSDLHVEAGVRITRSVGEGLRADLAFGSELRAAPGLSGSLGLASDGSGGMGGDGRGFGGMPPWGPPALGTGGPSESEAPMTASESVGPAEVVTASPGEPSPSAAAMAEADAADAAARLSRQAERALECILRDDVAGALLLDRPGAVPLLLRAVACGRASSGVAEALSDRAVAARAGGEAMTADLKEAMEALRGIGLSVSDCGGSSPACTSSSSSSNSAGSSTRSSRSLLELRCMAAGLLSAWAAGSSANRAKLTSLGLQGVLAEVATAVSGLNDRVAVGLQWQLLRLARVMAEHSSSGDSHHLATCVLPLMYTTADAAAAGDAAMASYAVDTLAAAIRRGGAPVAEVVSSSTMPHLLWQLAEGLGAQKVTVVTTAAPAADGKEVGAAASGTDEKSTASPAAATGKVKASMFRSWFLPGRGTLTGASSSAGQAPAPPAAAGGAAASGGGGGGASTAQHAAKSRKVMQVQDPTVAASVAAAVAELARCSLLPEAQIPRWRDWLLDVLCTDGFDPGTSAGITTATGKSAAASSGGAGVPSTPPAPQGAGAVEAVPLLPPRHRGEVRLVAAAAASTSSGCSSSGGSGSSLKVGKRKQQQLSLPAWLTLPERARQGPRAGGGCSGGSSRAVAAESNQDSERGRLGAVESMRSGVVAALSSLSHMPGNHGLQAAHYWLARLLSELAARTLPYTSLVYLEGPRAPQDLIHAVPVLPSYVRSVADALERAADAVADDSPPLPPHLEFDLAGSGLVARPTHDTQTRRSPAGGSSSSNSSGSSSSSSSSTTTTSGGNRRGAVGTTGTGSSASAIGRGSSGSSLDQHQLHQQERHAADVAAYLHAAHVVDVVVAERKAADALEALCAIVAPDPEKQRWLLHRGVLPLLHRLTYTEDDPSVILQEQGQPGAEILEQEAAREGMEAVAAANANAAAAAAAAATSGDIAAERNLRTVHGSFQVQPHHHHHHHHHKQPASPQYHHQHRLDPHSLPPHSHQQQQQYQQHPTQQQQQQQQINKYLYYEKQQQSQPHDSQQQGQPQSRQMMIQTQAVVSELMSDHEGGPSLCLQRQVARMLALMALLRDAADGIAGGGGDGGSGATAAATAGTWGGSGGSNGGGGDGWLPWLHHAASSSDCRLSSNATRALLHLAALDVNTAVAAAAGATAAAGDREPLADVTTAPAAPVFLDGIHLLDPGAQHHWALVRQAAAAIAAATAASATAAAEATSMHSGVGPATDVDDGTRTEDPPGLPVRPGASGAAAAVGITAETAATVEVPVALAIRPAGSTAEGGGIVVTAGCGAATSTEGSGDGCGALALPHIDSSVPSVAAALLSTVRYAVSLSFSLWSTAALGGPSLATSHGVVAAGAATVPLSLLTVAAATAAEPLQAVSRAAAAAEPSQPPPLHSESIGVADGGKEPLSSPSPHHQGSGAVADSNSKNINSSIGSLIPSAAIPPYPAPYADPGADAPDNQLSLPPHTDGSGGKATAAGVASSPPLVDVVFVHGIRGGPFITWRKAGVMTSGSAASHMERSACWPSTWLSEDLPGARLLSVEYLAPVSAWEGESLPLEDNVSRVMGQLAAAGVGTGQRPVVFVAHSMGGLLVKEMLARSMDQAASGGPHAALAPSTRGIVFFGTPHFGNAMAAMGWKLRHVPGALPAPSLARLTPGPHLLSLNDRLRQLHEAQGGALRVVSLMEGQPTQLSGVIPRILIVAADSAYPGFGAAMTLPNNDHIDCCKPASRSAPAYRIVRELVMHAVMWGAALPGGG